MNKLVSLIIPTYKRPEMLIDALKSVLHQTYKHIEVIVVNDNNISTIEYKETIENFEKFISMSYSQGIEYKLVNNEKNMGAATSRNIGVNFAKGDYITFLDDDDVYYAEKIEKQVNCMEKLKDEGYDMVFCQREDYENGCLISVSNNVFNNQKEAFIQNMKQCIAGTPTIMITKKAFISIDGFEDIPSHQDWFLIHKFLKKGFKLYSMEDILVKVNLHEGERISNSEQKIINMENTILPIKQQEFSQLNKKISQEIMVDHYMQLANMTKSTSLKKSIGYFYEAFKIEKINKKYIRYFGSLILSKSIIVKIKNIKINRG